MAALYGIEATIDAIIAKLGAELPAKVAALNAEIADEFQLLDPEGISLGSRSEVRYPWVLVRPQASEPLTDASGRMHTQHELEVAAWLEDSDEEGLARRLMRYERALREVVLHYRRPAASFTDGGGGYGLQSIGTVWGPTFELEDTAGRYVSWVAITVAVQQQQDLP